MNSKEITEFVEGKYFMGATLWETVRAWNCSSIEEEFKIAIAYHRVHTKKDHRNSAIKTYYGGVNPND